jgi:histidinol-phosphate/aromatic aminotransferase/cobyric acid decarboxylase-like protein
VNVPISNIFKKSLTKDSVKNYATNKTNGLIRLDLVSNPIGPPIEVMDFIQNISIKDISEYSNPQIDWELKTRLAQLNHVNQNQILITSGADQAIEIVLTHVINKDDNVGILIPSFPRFEIVANKLCGAKISFFSDINSIPKSKIIILCTPNSPTTHEIPKDLLIRTIQNNQNKLFIIDAVFCDFGSWDPSILLQEFGNLIILKSFSKSHGIAGARVGFIIANEKIISLLAQGISPFLVSNISKMITIKAIDNTNHIKKSISFVNEEFNKIKHNLGKNAIRNSNVPFFMLKVKNSIDAKKKLLKKGISIITEEHFRGLEKNTLRVKIGKPWENDMFIKIIKTL